MSFALAPGRMVTFCTRLSSLKFAQRDLDVAKHPAIVTFVWDKSKVNLQVLADGSNAFPKQAVTNDSSRDSWWEMPNYSQIEDVDFTEVRDVGC